MLALGFPLPPSAREIDEANRKVNGKHREGDRWVVSFYQARPCILRRLKEEDRAELLRLGFPLPPSAREIDEANRDFIATHRAGDEDAREAREKRRAAEALMAEAEALDARAEEKRAA